jgi:YHS domain-containing protein
MPKETPAPKPTYVTACGDRVDVLFRYPIISYKGRQVILCSADCLKQFKEDPDRFMSGEVIHTNSQKRTKVE